LEQVKNPGRLMRQTVIEPSRRWGSLNFRELWEYRELLIMLAMREVQLRYRQTFLGVAWVVLQPLLTTLIFTFIFGGLLGASSENVRYELFAFAGLIPWNVFSQSLQRGGVSLTRDLRLITKIFFPRVIIPMANALSTLVDFAVSFVILIILLVIYRVPITWSFLSLPLILALTLLLSIGMGVIFAALNVYYRDFTYVLPFLIQVWLFVSPLAYSSSIIPKNWEWVYSLNPMAGIIDGFRWAVFGTIAFPARAMGYSVVVSVLVFTIGMLVFRRLERSFADVI